MRKALGAIEVPEKDLPIRAVIFPNEGFAVRQLDITEVGIWDISNPAEGLGWDGPIRIKVLGDEFNLKNAVSDYVCTDRGMLLNVLAGLTPVLVLLLTLSWVFYDFPKVVKKSVSNLVLWGLLAIGLVVSILLLYGLPSLDLEDYRVYVIAASFVLPLIYVVWAGVSMLERQDYP